jgi:hypothetical protein
MVDKEMHRLYSIFVENPKRSGFLYHLNKQRAAQGRLVPC